MGAIHDCVYCCRAQSNGAVPFVNRSFLLSCLLSACGLAYGHGVASADQAFIEGNRGMHLVPYLYLGAKHMVTGYDHLLFLCGVVFFLYRMKDVALYVTLFAVGHSTTLLLGVLNGWHVNPYAVDAIIGLSIVYRAVDNLGGFRTLLGFQPDKKAAASASPRSCRTSPSRRTASCPTWSPSTWGSRSASSSRSG
jgi:hypothetical protein